LLFFSLGIPRDATEKQISSAYKKLALKYHPDRNPDGGEDTLPFYKAATEAYQVLSDPVKKKNYDSTIGNENSIDSQPVAK
jgi:DnaJ-class molecular chaperone